MINFFPYDEKTHSNPWLMNSNNSEAIIGPEGERLTADYIWSKKGEDRENLVLWVFQYYRKKGFPFNFASDEEMKKEFYMLVQRDPDDVIDENGEIKNSSNLGNKIYRTFLGKEYFCSRGGKNTRSLWDAFHNDDILLKVLKNRMGYCLSGEDGEERPYVFTITDKMVLQGIRSSSMGYNVSLFKPIIAKYLYKHFSKKRIFDYSSGWGARSLAAISLGREYYGVDPLTAEGINTMIQFFNGSGYVICGCSEDRKIYDKIPIVDCIMSSPPYYDLEYYGDSDLQSINRYRKYNEWLELYWNRTVENCISILDKQGYFILVVKNKIRRYNLEEDMKKVCENNSLKIEKTMNIRTSNSHLSGKKKTKKISKNTEIVYIFKR